MEPHEVDTILRSLAATMEQQRLINDDLREFNRQQLTINERVASAIARVTTAIERLEVTLAAIKDMLGRGNGH